MKKQNRQIKHLASLFALLCGLALLNACNQYQADSGNSQAYEPQPIAPSLKYAEESALENNSESYEHLAENDFFSPFDAPYSTFSIDVDAASYANARRFLNQGTLPPADAVRAEEFINYFTYDYPAPKSETPFALYTELSQCPWNTKHKLVHIGMQGRDVAYEYLPPSNLVFLIDVSGSMGQANKLPLLKQSVQLLIEKLRPQDHVAMVVYAGAAGLVLPSTPGDEKLAILEALDKLEAGGSTAGSAGIELAYEVAEQHLVKGGNNRIIIATDGDFNVGPSSDGELERLVEEKRKGGVHLTVLGFGMGNYKDSKMQTLADKGNGNHAYIDNILEAQKVLVNEFGGTLFTIAKDVKLQVEFNPESVMAYRLIGYENRMLQDQDFHNDQKDAGELGSGHTVTALYEIIPAHSPETIPSVDPPRYQETEPKNEWAKVSGEMLHIKVRYKAPDGDESFLVNNKVLNSDAVASNPSANFKWSAAVAEFAMLLRDSKYKGNSSYDQVLKLAQESLGEDAEGYRAEFIGLVKRARALDHRSPMAKNE